MVASIQGRRQESWSVMEYRETWDLSSIPADVWASEHGRRQRAKGPRVTYAKLEPCLNRACKAQLNATQRRLPACPECGRKQQRRLS